jgi:hypothetical protein
MNGNKIGKEPDRKKYQVTDPALGLAEGNEESPPKGGFPGKTITDFEPEIKRVAIHGSDPP